MTDEAGATGRAGAGTEPHTEPVDEARAAGPTTVVVRRALAPDLARGVMLAMIALAHAPAYRYDAPAGIGGYPTGDAVIDRVVAFALTDVVNGRTYPMFAALFGYGLTQLVLRRSVAGVNPTHARRLVRRRGLALLGLGLGHAALLWAGDILGAYGVVAVLLAGLVPWVRGRLVVMITTGSLLVVTVGAMTRVLASVGGADIQVPSTGESDPFAAVGVRILEWLPTLALQPLGVAGAVAVGIWAARKRVLEEPERHRTLLRRTAIGGLALALLGGLPLAVITALELMPSTPALLVAGGLHGASGYGGVGFAALAGLIVLRVRSRSGRDGAGSAGAGTLGGPGVPRVPAVIRALVACGERSLTCYLTQSVVFGAALAAYGGGLGNRFGLATAALFAITTWVTTVAMAEVLSRRGHRGPAERLLRRLTYGRMTDRDSAAEPMPSSR